MVTYELQVRAECTNEIRPGKMCGAHVAEGQTWCPVCGEATRTRRIGGFRYAAPAAPLRTSGFGINANERRFRR
jgi:hypothetical protein